MADKRTVFPIPANTWTRVVNGATAAKIYKSIATVDYHSMIFNAAGDTPIDQSVFDTATAEKIFIDNPVNESVADSAAIYVWLRCPPDKVGSVIVTI